MSEDRLREAITRGMFRNQGAAAWSEAKLAMIREMGGQVYDEVTALARAEAAEHDKALEAMKGQLELAWRTIRRHFPHAAEKRTLAGAILHVSALFSGVHTELKDEQDRADLAEEKLRQIELEAAKPPGFQTILKAIAERCMAAKAQYDNDTMWKLDTLHDAASALLLPGPDKPTVDITFTWPQGGAAPHRVQVFHLVTGPYDWVLAKNSKMRLEARNGRLVAVSQEQLPGWPAL